MPALPNNWSLEAQREYLWGVDAGVGAIEDGKGADVQQKVTAAISDVETKMKARDVARQASRRARATLRIADVRYDTSITQISGTAFLAAGKNEKAEPYRSLFGAIGADDAKSMGPSKATGFGSDLIAKAKVQNHAQVMPLLPEFEKRVVQLAAASEARDIAVRTERTHEVVRLDSILALEKATAGWELDLRNALKDVSGARDLVRTILAVPREATTSKQGSSNDSQ